VVDGVNRAHLACALDTRRSEGEQDPQRTDRCRGRHTCQRYGHISPTAAAWHGSQFRINKACLIDLRVNESLITKLGINETVG
jgi:hypothetical protein